VDSFSGMPRQLELSNSFFIDALAEVTETVVRAVLRTLEQLPPDLCEDILQQGIILAGGGALLRGLQETIRDRIRVPVSVADDALFCVAEGTRRILEDFDHFKPVLYHA
jgi:rod shape-determining protein MreB